MTHVYQEKRGPFHVFISYGSTILHQQLLQTLIMDQIAKKEDCIITINSMTKKIFVIGYEDNQCMQEKMTIKDIFVILNDIKKLDMMGNLVLEESRDGSTALFKKMKITSSMTGVLESTIITMKKSDYEIMYFGLRK